MGLFVAGVTDGRLRALEESGLLEDDVNEAFDRITRLARQVLGASTALISLVAEDRQSFKGHDGLRADLAEAGGTPLSHSFCKYAVATGEPLVVDDARESPLLAQSPAIEDHGVVAYAGVPLKYGDDGAVLGTLCVVEPEARDWTEQELATLAELAEIARSEVTHRVRDRNAELVERLALRLPDPVGRLGDAVRTTVGLVEQPDDPRLPRTADVARNRFQAVEALADDLARAAHANHRQVADVEPAGTDLVQRLQHAVGLIRSASRPEDLALDIVAEAPLQVSWSRAELDRALALTLVTALHHCGMGAAVTVSLGSDDSRARLTVHSPGHAVPVGELLRVVGAYRPDRDSDPSVDVTSRPGGARVRSPFAVARSAPDGTTVETVIPLMPDEATGTSR